MTERIIIENSSILKTWGDIKRSAQAYEFWTAFAWNDIKVRYRRSRIGQFWITLSIAIFITGVGFFYSEVLNIPVEDYLPHLGCGFVIWHLISSIIVEGGQCYIESTHIIQQQKIPLVAFPMRIVTRNTLIFIHNFIIIAFIWLFFGVGNPLYIPLAALGLLLLVICGTWTALILGMISARFRDVPQIIQSLIQVAFFMTPVLWQSGKVGAKGEAVAFYNPITHFLEIVRQPLLGQLPEAQNWIVALVLTLLVTILGTVFFHRYRSRITYWL